VQALYRRVPVRRHRRRRSTLSGVQRIPLPPLRHLHGRLPGTCDLIRELLGGYGGLADQGVDMPDQFSEKPRILVLACENDAYPALDMAP